MNLKDKSILITGAASGIGRAVARRFGAQGARLMLGDINGDALEDVARTIGGQTRTQTFDVADPDACARIVETASSAAGRLDVLCNIAGILRIARLADIGPAEWARIIAVNLGGVYHMSRSAMPHLVESRGCIVNLASTAGLIGVPFNSAYTASKHGVVGLTRSMALEFANAGVRVNAVCPTGVRTPMTAAPPGEGVDWQILMRAAPLLNGGELCEPDDIADAVAFLASDAAKRITGVAFPVDGGQTAI